MTLCDTSLWLALAIAAHVHHPVARTWFDTVAEPGSALFCRATQQALLRLLTSRAVMAPYGLPALSSARAWEVYERFTRDYRVGVRMDEPADLEPHWRRFALRTTPSPKLWMDAYLAAFAVAAGLKLVTTDTGFRQFPPLDVLILA